MKLSNKLYCPKLGSNRLALLGFILSVFSGNGVAGNANLAWNASSSPGVGGYKVFYGQTSKNYSSSVDVGNKTSHQLTGLADGATYYFAVKAYNTSRTVESALSNEVSATSPAVAALTTSFTASKTSGTAPMVVTFTPADNAAITSWNWNFGTTAIPAATSKIPTVTFSSAGTYTVKLTANGGAATATQTITVAAAPAPAPVPVATPKPAPAPAPKPAPSPIPAQSPAPATATPGLVAAYRFEEAGGLKVVDASGKGNLGAIKEAARTAGRFNNGLKFDGINDVVSILDSDSLDLTTGMTLEAWVNPSDWMTGWTTLLMKEQNGGLVYSLNPNSNTNVPSIITFVNGAERYHRAGSQLVPNKWVHLAATYDGQNQRMYVDGVLVSSKAQTGPILASTGRLSIGGNSIWGEYFKGMIDEVRIYNRALTNAEIQKDMATAIAVSNPAQPVLGQNQLESFVDASAAGVAVAYRTSPQKNSALTHVNVYLDSTSTATKELVAGVYADNNGQPGVLLGQGKLVAPKAGATNSVSLPAVSLTAGKQYWIAMLSPNGEIKFRDRKGSAAAPMVRSPATRAFNALPSQWLSGTVHPTDGPMSAYGAGY